MTRLLLAVPALFAVAALAGAARPPASARADTSATADTLTVVGTGSVTAVPDDAQLSFGVDSRASTAKAALAANGAALQKVIDALRAAGARDIATQWVGVSPYDRNGGAIAGYDASNSVSATIGVGRAGVLIDAAVAAGANQVSGPDLSSADAERLYERALGNAVANARAHAEVLAKAAGRTLGAVTAIVEGGVQPVQNGAVASTPAGATPIVPGQQQTSAMVTVTFALG
jgi:uncharacterized protein YggE